MINKRSKPSFSRSSNSFHEGLNSDASPSQFDFANFEYIQDPESGRWIPVPIDTFSDHITPVCDNQETLPTASDSECSSPSPKRQTTPSKKQLTVSSHITPLERTGKDDEDEQEVVEEEVVEDIDNDDAQVTTPEQQPHKKEPSTITKKTNKKSASKRSPKPKPSLKKTKSPFEKHTTTEKFIEKYCELELNADGEYPFSVNAGELQKAFAAWCKNEDTSYICTPKKQYLRKYLQDVHSIHQKRARFYPSIRLKSSTPIQSIIE